MRDRYQVVIVGAGPSAIFAALTLMKSNVNLCFGIEQPIQA